MLLAVADLAAVQPDLIGVAITSLVGSLGAAGAAVAVTYYFLGFLQTERGTRQLVLDELRDYHAESQKRFQDQLERLGDRQGMLIADLRQALAEQRQSFRAELQAITSKTIGLTGDMLAVLTSTRDILDSTAADRANLARAFREARPADTHDGPPPAAHAGIVKALGDLQVSINGIDVMVRRMIEVGCRPRPDPQPKTVGDVMIPRLTEAGWLPEGTR